MPQPTPGGPSVPLAIHVPTAGGTRDYLLSLPTGYSSSCPTPLILAFHGKGQDGAQFERQTQLSDSAFNTMGAVLAFPNGINKQWTGDPKSPPRHELGDIAFARELLSHVTTTSHGTIVSGAFYKDKSLKGDEALFDRCEPARSPFPILEMHGSKDPVIHYDGRGTPDGETYPIEEWLLGWRKRNGCEEGSREEVQDIHEGNVRNSVWWNKEGQEVVVHYYIRGFGHGWPSTKKQDDDHQTYGPLKWDGTRDIVSFLECKRLP